MFGLNDAPNSGHLGKDTVFEAGNEPLDVLRSRLRFAHGKRTGPTQGREGSLEPLQRSGIVSFEQFDRFPVDARQPQQAVGLIRLEATCNLATLERPRRDEEKIGKDLQRQRHEPKDLQQRAKGESLLDLLLQCGRVERSQAKQYDVRVGTSGPPDGLEIRVDLRGARTRP